MSGTNFVPSPATVKKAREARLQAAAIMAKAPRLAYSSTSKK